MTLLFPKQHLASLPNPRRFSSLGRRLSTRERMLDLNDAQIPPTTVVDDTSDRYWKVMLGIIARAKQRAGIA